MPEQNNSRKVFTLLEVSKSIQKTLTERYQSIFWVKAEMNKLNHYPQSGHCYPDLVEKSGGKVIAEMKGILWKDDFLRINSTFLRILHEPLKDGITILFCARITYDPVYGLTLRIFDIDPSYSLGEMEREKQETIARLRKEGVFTLNKSLVLPLLPKRIAIISVETSKGFSDFMSVINGNRWGYHFFCMLFPAILQGERAVDSILFQLNQIRRVINHFDAVAIIRGGGGDVGLNCYNSFTLASELARFPVPVLTGIGHSTNETVIEMIAYRNAITPTELADFLIQLYHNFAVPVQEAQKILIEKSGRIISDEKSALLHSVKFFRSVTGSLISSNSHNIRNSYKVLCNESRYLIKLKQEMHELYIFNLKKNIPLMINSHDRILDHLQQKLNLLDPINILKRGYSITRINGRSINSLNEIREDQLVETQVADGKFLSTIKTLIREHE